MPDDNVVKMVNSLAADDNVAAQGAFKDALASKIGTALDGKRQTVAKDWLNAAQDLEATKDAAGLDKVAGAIAPSVLGAEVEPTEPVEIDQDEKEDEQPTV